MGIEVNIGKGSLYLWLPGPEDMSSIEFAAQLFDKTNIVVAPGVSYGSQGEGYYRVSLTVEDEDLAEAMRRIKQFSNQ